MKWTQNELRNRKGIESKANELLKEIEDIPDESRPFLIDSGNIFAVDGESTGHTSVMKHTNDTRDAKRIALRPQRTAVQYHDFVREEISNVLKKGSLGRPPQLKQHPKYWSK